MKRIREIRFNSIPGWKILAWMPECVEEKRRPSRSPSGGTRTDGRASQIPIRRLRNLWKPMSIPDPPKIMPNVPGSGIAVSTISFPPVVEFVP